MGGGPSGASPETSGAEAAELTHAMVPQLVVPCHFDMFEFNTESPDEFVAECRRLWSTISRTSLR